MLPTVAIKEFKEIYFKEFGIKLSEEETIKKANDFMDLFKVLVKQPINIKKEGVLK